MQCSLHMFLITLDRTQVELEDMDYDAEEEMWTYPCPCGDIFQIFREDLQEGKEAAYCPSCTLVLRVIYDKNEFNNEEGAGGDGDAEIAVVAEVPPPAEVEGVETAPERIVQDSDTDVEA